MSTARSEMPRAMVSAVSKWVWAELMVFDH
jgi:hypothetical protein